MNKNIEKEYKILVTEEQFYELLKKYPEAKFHTQVNTYYDTVDLQICKAKGAMRIREVNDKFIFTLKLHSEDGLLEFETEVPSNDTTAFQQQDVVELLQSYQLMGPITQLTALTTQRAMIVSDEAELCFDINDYNGICDYEIEYEYKKEHDGRSIFNNLLASCNLHYISNCPSKIIRALDSK